MKQEHKNFKPFDKVLIRYNENHEWIISLYSHWSEEENQHILHYGNVNDNNITPFEGNEDLLGKVGEPKPKRWRAEYGQPYWFVDISYEEPIIVKSTEDNDDIDVFRYALDNYFQTKEQAKEKIEQIKQIWKGE